MSQPIQKKTHKEEAWKLEFEYPSTWIVNSGLGGSFQVHHTTPVNGWRPNVEFQIVESTSLNIPEIIEELLPSIQQSSTGFSLLDKKIKKDGNQRGGILYKYREGTINLISQKILVPIADNKILSITGTTEITSWEQFAPLIKLIVSSARSPKVETSNNNDLEIVYGDSPAFGVQNQPKDKPQSGTPVTNNTFSATPQKSTVSKSKRDFATFAKNFDRQWSQCLITDEILEFVQDLEIAKVLWAALGSKIKCWISDPLPALDNKSVLNCARSLQGRRQIKEMLSKLNDNLDNLFLVAKEAISLNMEELDDSEKVKMVEELLVVGPERQDWEWSREIDELLTGTQLYVPDRPFATSSSGFLHHWLFTYEPTDFRLGRRAQLTDIIPEIIGREAGLAIGGANGGIRGYRYGDCLFYSKEHRWYHPRWEPLPPDSLVKVDSSPAVFGPPSDNLLPAKAQLYLKEKMRGYGVKKPAVVLGYDPRQKPAYMMFINLLDGNISKDNEINQAMDILHWATPPFSGIVPCLTKDFPSYGLEL